MTIIRVECDYNDTGQLLYCILKILNQDYDAEFVCPAGMGQSILNRLRIMLSRQRKAALEEGLKIGHFKMNTKQIKTYHDVRGNRRDAVVLTMHKSNRDMIRDKLHHKIQEGIANA